MFGFLYVCLYCIFVCFFIFYTTLRSETDGKEDVHGCLSQPAECRCRCTGQGNGSSFYLKIRRFLFSSVGIGAWHLGSKGTPECEYWNEYFPIKMTQAHLYGSHWSMTIYCGFIWQWLFFQSWPFVILMSFFSLSSLSTVASTVASNQCFFCANMSHLKLAAIKLRHKFSTTTHHLVDFELRHHGPHRK